MAAGVGKGWAVDCQRSQGAWIQKAEQLDSARCQPAACGGETRESSLQPTPWAGPHAQAARQGADSTVVARLEQELAQLDAEVGGGRRPARPRSAALPRLPMAVPTDSADCASPCRPSVQPPPTPARSWKKWRPWSVTPAPRSTPRRRRARPPGAPRKPWLPRLRSAASCAGRCTQRRGARARVRARAGLLNAQQQLTGWGRRRAGHHPPCAAACVVLRHLPTHPPPPYFCKAAA